MWPLTLIAEDRPMGKIKDARAGQRLLADYETRVQHGPERVHGVVPVDASDTFGTFGVAGSGQPYWALPVGEKLLLGGGEFRACEPGSRWSGDGR